MGVFAIENENQHLVDKITFIVVVAGFNCMMLVCDHSITVRAYCLAC